MKKRNIYFIGLLFAVMASGSPVFILAAEEASTMMCDEGVVNIGDADVDVQEKCGEPNTKGMNKWVYNFGPSQPVYTVIFKEGKVVRILANEWGN
jgi:hypothetical protein